MREVTDATCRIFLLSSVRFLDTSLSEALIRLCDWGIIDV